MERDIKTKISRSNVRLMVDKQKKGWGFYSSILLQMPMIEKDDILTMATNGKDIFYRFRIRKNKIINLEENTLIDFFTSTA